VTEGWPETSLPVQRLGVPWKLVLAGWSVAATMAVLQTVVGYLIRDQLAREWPWALLQFPRWLSWALFTPVIVAASQYLPLRRPRLGRAIAAHLALALLLGLMYEAFWFWFTRLFDTVMTATLRPAPLSLQISVLILPRLLSDAFTYAAVLGLITALDYHDRLRERETQGARLEAELALAQVQALKMQVHPHFLFNTLHAVNVLIQANPRAATRMVAQLGDLLRLTLSRASRAEVPFGAELEILKLYLDIERTRFHDRLRVQYEVDPATLPALVPDLILQPLVENAIRHGVSPLAADAQLLLRSKRENEWLILEIRDNGRGLPPGQRVAEGVGLTTTRTRLERLYGQNQKLTLETAADGGCTARVSLPFRLNASGNPGAGHV
jgi:sensor histidine kinase YesM